MVPSCVKNLDILSLLRAKNGDLLDFLNDSNNLETIYTSTQTLLEKVGSVTDDTSAEIVREINTQVAEMAILAAVIEILISRLENNPTHKISKLLGSKNVFTVFVAGLPRKLKLPFADWYSTCARSFSKAVCSFPTRKSCALLPIASAILQNGAIRFVWQSLPPHQSTPVPTKQMPYPCNHRQQGLFVPHQDYPAHVPRLAGSLFYP